MLDHFWDVDHGGLFTTADDGERLIVRQKDVFDNATPSANSTAAIALLRLSALTGEARYANHAERILATPGPARSPGAERLRQCPRRRRPADPRHHRGRHRRRPPRPPRLWFASDWRPEIVLAWGERYDSPLWESRRDGYAYVCEHYACQAPADTPETLRAQL